MKRCFKCKVLKSIDEFYKHPRMADGHLGKCKPCACQDVRENRNARWDQYAEFDRRRGGGRRKTPLDATKRAAHVAVGNAVKSGRLVRQPCEKCGDVEAQAHHDDYSKPLDVRWLCFTHHREHHGQKTAKMRKADART